MGAGGAARRGQAEGRPALARAGQGQRSRGRADRDDSRYGAGALEKKELELRQGLAGARNLLMEHPEKSKPQLDRLLAEVTALPPLRHEDEGRRGRPASRSAVGLARLASHRPSP